MPSLTVLYTRPEQDAEAFLQEYREDHVPIALRFPGLARHSVVTFTGTPRGGEAPYYVMFHGEWDSAEAMQAAMQDPAMMEASQHAMGMVRKYGNSAEMLLGE